MEDRVLTSTLLHGFVQTVVARGLSKPSGLVAVPDGRVFVIQQTGQVRVIQNGHLLPTPLLSVTTDSSVERGLVGITIDPNFATNHYVYVYYTVPGTPAHDRVSRFTVSGNTAAPSSEVVLLDLPPLGDRHHNGGSLQFGADGKLYVAVGENNVPANSQLLSTPLGKILRINPDGTIPTDNPFYDQTTGINRAIWAIGLRNPFSTAVQPGTGLYYINDVGADTWEKIDKGVAALTTAGRSLKMPLEIPGLRTLFTYTTTAPTTLTAPRSRREPFTIRHGTSTRRLTWVAISSATSRAGSRCLTPPRAG